MRLVCPGCGAAGSLAALVSDAEARACMAEIAQLPDGVAHAAVEYLALFRPPKRALSWSRAHRLLADLSGLMASPALHRGGQDHAVTPVLWQAALAQVVDQRERLTLPLKTHGYLLTILASLAQHSAGAAEAKHEGRLRSGLQTGHGASNRAFERRLVAGENGAREQLGLKKLTMDEIPAFLKRELAHERA